MSRLIVSNIETQNIKFDSDTTAFTIGSDGGIKAEGTATTNLQTGLVKHYIVFDQKAASGYSDVSGATLRDSFNCSTVTDVSAGIGEPQFINNMGDNKYSTVVSSHYQGNVIDSERRYSRFAAPCKFSTSAYAYGAQYVNGSSQDCYMTSHVTGNLG